MTLKTLTIISTVLLAVLMTMPSLTQQDDGQFCVRAFEDRDADGERDPGEPLITRGLGANLLDSQGVIIETGLMDTSPTGAQGVLCFENLANTQYTVAVTSADYLPTTMDNMTINISDAAQTRTTVFEFGGQQVDTLAEAPTSVVDTAATDQDAILERVLISSVGAAIAMLVTLFLGFILYALLLRGGRREYIDPRDTGAMPRPDTGEYPRQQ